ncbi:3293_t:CDS:1, partial [Acaulospora colombiana]
RLSSTKRNQLLNLNPCTDVEWSGLWQDYGRPDMIPVPLANGTSPNIPWPVEIYRETATSIWINSATFEPADANNGTFESPVVYKIANASMPAIATIGMTEDDSFTTEISFKQASDGGDIMKQPLFAYPYDE